MPSVMHSRVYAGKASLQNSQDRPQAWHGGPHWRASSSVSCKGLGGGGALLLGLTRTAAPKVSEAYRHAQASKCTVMHLVPVLAV